MLNITKNTNASELTVSLTGRLDTTTAPELEKELKASLDGVTTLVIDMSALDYISSAGLRVLLQIRKAVYDKGGVKIVNANDLVKEVFEVTGFINVLNIE